MNQVEDIYKLLHRSGQERRARNRAKSTEMLRRRGVAFLTRNEGNHLIVEAHERQIDFWPSTGAFIFRDTGQKGRGVFNLLEAIGLTEVTACAS